MKVDLDAGASGERGRAAANVVEGPGEAVHAEGERSVSERTESLGAMAAAAVEEINGPLACTIANIGDALEALGRLDVDLTVGDADPDDDDAARIARARVTMFTIAGALREARQGGDRLRRIVRDLEIAVESASDDGARVCVSLPGGGDSAVVPVRAPVGGAARGPRGCVLVIDDEPLMTRAVQRLLEAEHDVVMASDPREATALVMRGARYDAILCDLMMPGMSGMEVYEAIARAAPEQARRIVFMTGGAFTSRTKTFLDSLENPRVEKPLEYAALRAILRGQLANPIER